MYMYTNKVCYVVNDNQSKELPLHSLKSRQQLLGTQEKKVFNGLTSHPKDGFMDSTKGQKAHIATPSTSDYLIQKKSETF